MTSHLLAGSFSVEVSARRIRQYRYVEERMTRTMAGWIALTPELPAKLVLGRQVWDCAQHADAWGKRLPELRSPAQRSEPANDRVARFMELLEAPDGPDETAERLVGLYRVLKPHLVAVYEQHLAIANSVYEPPTRRILERCIADERCHVAAGAAALARLTGTDRARARAEILERELVEALGDAGGVAGDGDVRRAALDTSADPASDVAAPDAPFDVSRLDVGLRETLQAVGCAAAANDARALALLVASHARETLLGAYGGVAADAAVIIACAKIGASRIVKLRLTGADGTSSILQLQCRPAEDGWRVTDARQVGGASAG